MSVTAAGAKAASYTEALSEYLQGAEWRENVDYFIRSNCSEFRLLPRDDASASHKLHGLWKTFQEIVESILEVALMAVGGSLSSLERALDDISRLKSGAKGPRQEAVSTIAERLLCYTDYHAFTDMMNSAAMDSGEVLPTAETIPAHPRAAAAARYSPSTYQQSKGENSAPYRHHRENLLNMGFSADLIDAVLPEEEGQDVSLERLIDLLSEMSAGADAKADAKSTSQGSKGVPQYSSGHLHGTSSHSLTVEAPASPQAQGGHQPTSLPHVEAFSKACGVQDASAMTAKFAIARSLLDSFAQEGAGGGAALLLLQWGSEMMSLYARVEAAFSQGQALERATASASDGAASGSGGGGEKRLVEWFSDLEALRRQCDDLEGGGGMVSDAELRRMAELDRLASMGTEDEALMHTMITRHDKVREELNVLHKRCGALISVGSGVSRETLEELYLYLKDKVASGADLVALSEELHEHVYSLITDGQRAGSCVSVLLDMHILEDEQFILRQRINAALSPGGHDRAAPASDFFAADAKDAGPSPSPSPSSPSGSIASPARLAVGRRGPDEEDENKPLSSSPASASAEAKTTPAASRRRFDHKQVYESAEKGSEEDKIVAALMDRHKQSVAQLRASLEVEKSRRLSELEQRLHRRRLLRDKEVTSARAAMMPSSELAALEASLEAAEGDIRREMARVVTDVDVTKASLISGFKRRCVFEIKACKEKGLPLTEEEELASQRAAAEAIRKRHERDSANLLESLADQKAKQRARLQAMLTRRCDAERRGAAYLPEDGDLAEADVLAELRDLDVVYSVQEAAALKQAQQQVLLQLAGVHVSTSKVLPAAAGQAGPTSPGDDDDALLQALASPRGGPGEAAGVRYWLEGVEALSDAFLGSASDLQGRLASAFRSDSGDDSGQGQGQEEEEEEEEVQRNRRALAAFMNKVVVNSFNSQVAPPSAFFSAGGGAGGADLDAERVKRAILSEFEKSQGEYHASLQRAKDASAALLRKRKTAWGNNSANKDPTPPDVDIIGAFSLAPAVLSASGADGPGARRTTKADEDALLRLREADRQARADQEAGGRIRKAHSEKEATLLRGLFLPLSLPPLRPGLLPLGLALTLSPSLLFSLSLAQA